jgi:twitching motility protein PilT
MARIDKFIKAIHQSGGERLVMAAGQKAVMILRGQPRSISAQPASPQQIQDLIREILPDGSDVVSPDGGENRFDYAAPSGAVEVRITGSDGTLRLDVAPAGSAARDQAAASGAAMSAAEHAAAPPTEPAASTAAVPHQIEAAAQSAAGNEPAPPVATAPPAAAQAAPSTTAGPATPRLDPSRMEALFRRMYEQSCSDLHLSSGHPPLFRKDGEIILLGDEATNGPEQVENLLRSIAPDRHWKIFEETHDADFSYEVTGVARFRCNVFMDRLGPAGVFRLIPSVIPTAQELGLSRHIMELCHLTKGLVLVVGPTGSGKSTTLAAMIDYINKQRSEHILTIEDPIEFVHPQGKALINQREVGVHTRGFKTALRAALREDPDIVLVGEMRDLETVAIALETAETGHLVFGTLHTNTAPSTVDRIIDQFPADEQGQIRTMLSESLKAVIAQTLCKKLGGGRVAAHEVLIVNSAISNLIREGKTYQIPSIMQTGRALGMMTLNDTLVELVRRKIVDPQEAYAKAVAKTDLTAGFERNGIKFTVPSDRKPAAVDGSRSAA